MYRTPRKKFADNSIFPTRVQNYDQSVYKEELLQQINEKTQRKKEEENQSKYFSTKISSPYIEGFYFTPKKTNPQKEALKELITDMQKKMSKVNKIYDELIATKKKKSHDYFNNSTFSIFKKSSEKNQQVKKQQLDSAKLFNNKNNQFFFSQKYQPSLLQKNNLNQDQEIQQINNFDLEGIRDKIKERKFQEKRERFEKYVEHILPDELNSYIKDYFDNNFRQFQKDVQKNQFKVYEEINELKKFTNKLKQSQERDSLDFQLLQSQIKDMQKDEIYRRNDLFDALNKTSQKKSNFQKFQNNLQNIKNQSILKEITNLVD